MMEERLVKGEYCLSTSGVGSPPHSLPSTSGTQNDKIEDVHCACISKLETQVEEQVIDAISNFCFFLFFRKCCRKNENLSYQYAKLVETSL